MPGTRIQVFLGKGGVGKTTCSAATALALAERGAPSQVISRSGSCAQDFFGQNCGAHTAPARGVKAFFHGHVVVDKDALDRYAFGMNQLRSGLEVHNVTGVVFNDEQHTGTAVHGLGALVNLVRCR